MKNNCLKFWNVIYLLYICTVLVKVFGEKNSTQVVVLLLYVKRLPPAKSERGIGGLGD